MLPYKADYVSVLYIVNIYVFNSNFNTMAVTDLKKQLIYKDFTAKSYIDQDLADEDVAIEFRDELKTDIWFN